MQLNNEDFYKVVQYTPLISIDFIIQNEENAVLLGERKNRPAKGFWFVPGGRIYKNETISEAFNRISLNELGTKLDIQQASFLGVYDHIYLDNVFENDSFGTHYVVLGYKISLEFDLKNLPKLQHKTYKWFKLEDLHGSSFVHSNTKAYFT